MNDETELARWLATGQSLEKMDGEKYDLQTIKRALDQIDQVMLPPMDVDEAWQNLDSKKEDQSNRSIRSKAWIISIAASILVIMGIFFVTRFNHDAAVDFAEGTLATLPDGRSHAIFKDQSSLIFDLDNPSQMELQGSAYFHVESGEPFSVSGKFGQVEVLGTSFEIDGGGSEFLIKCYSGSVRVSIIKDEKVILSPGEGIQVNKNGTKAITFKESSPLWLVQKSLQENLGFAGLLQLLELEYDIRLQNPDNIAPRLNGGLPLDNLELALEILETSLNLNITQTSEKSYVVKQR